jgi:hypothetical protein
MPVWHGWNYATLFRSRGYRMDSLLLYGSVCSTASETMRLPYDGKYLAPTLSIPSLCATVISGVIGHNGYGGDCRLILESSCAHPLSFSMSTHYRNLQRSAGTLIWGDYMGGWWKLFMTLILGHCFYPQVPVVFRENSLTPILRSAKF